VTSVMTVRSSGGLRCSDFGRRENTHCDGAGAGLAFVAAGGLLSARVADNTAKPGEQDTEGIHGKSGVAGMASRSGKIEALASTSARRATVGAAQSLSVGTVAL